MAKAKAEPKATREVILDAALQTLKEQGFARTSARAIARAGEFNQALIFYHFGSVNELLLAALDRIGEERLARYRAAVEEAKTFEELVAVAARIYREDLEQGHMTVVAEMIAGSVADPELRPEMMTRTQVWVDFVEEVAARALAGSPFAGMLHARDVAFALVAFYCGVNIFTRLEEDHSRTEALFDMAARAAPLLQPMFPGGLA
jgi:AcrR family transcriptional regulator